MADAKVNGQAGLRPRVVRRNEVDGAASAGAATSGGGKILDDPLTQEYAAGAVGHGLVASLFSYITLGN